MSALAQAPTFVQKFEGEHTAAGATSVVGSPSVGNAGANHLLFCAGTVLIAATNVGFSDNVGLVWNNIVLPNIVQTVGSPFLPSTTAMTDGNAANQTYFAWASTGASTTVSSVTLSWTTSVNTSSIHCVEYSNANLSSPIDAICTMNGPFVQQGGHVWPVANSGFNCDVNSAFTNEIIVVTGQWQALGSHLSLHGYGSLTYIGHDGAGSTFNTNPDLTFTTRAGGASSTNGIIIGDAGANGMSRINSTDATDFTWGMVTGMTVKGSGSQALQSIMKGCAVSPTNVPNCTIPNGWTLRQAEGFDTGSLGAGEALGLLAFETTKTHSGSKAVSYQVNAGGAIPNWTITMNARDTYASWWEFLDSTVAVTLNFAVGSRNNTQLLFDREPPIMCWYNCASARMTMYAQGTSPVPNFSVFAGDYDSNFGQWNQWEMHAKVNDPNVANGTMELWMNGDLVMGIYNTNFTGAQDGATYNIQLAGDYEDRISYTDGTFTVCSPPNVTGFLAANYINWTTTINACPLQSPPNGHGPTYTQYLDDIIILTCATPGTCSTLSPGTTIPSGVKVTSGTSIK